MKNYKNVLLVIATMFLLDILVTSCCTKGRRKDYNYIDVSPELKAYFGMYDILGNKWIYQNRDKTITDTFEVVRVIDSVSVERFNTGTPVPGYCGSEKITQHKGFVLKTKTFGNIKGTWTDSDAESVSLYNYNQNNGFFMKVYFYRDGFYPDTLKKFNTILLNDSTYYGNIIRFPSHYFTSGMDIKTNSFVMEKTGLIAFVINKDTFNLIKSF